MNSQASPDVDTDNAAPDDPPSPPRLDLFALPSLTTLLFALIAGVILAAVLAGLKQNPSLIGWMIAAGMVVLPLRDFLRQIEQGLYSLGLPRDSADRLVPGGPLVQEVEAAARDLGLAGPPRLIIAPGSVSPTTLGTWRQRYLVLGSPQAQCLAGLPAGTRRALWLHEAAHFASGDSWKVGLARSLLRVSVWFMAWSAFFLLGIVLMALIYGLEVFEPGYLNSLSIDPSMRQLLTAVWPDPLATAPLLANAKTIHPGLAALYVLNAHLPFVVSGIVLLLFVWRRLVQVREFYADARAAAQIGDAAAARNALNRVAVALALVPSAAVGRFRGWVIGLGKWFDRVMPFHPSWQARLDCLQNPLQVFGSWGWAGFTAGLGVLLLDLILVGPFTLAYVSAGPAHLATLAGFIVLALWLLPRICQGPTSTKQLAQQVLGATTVFVGLRAGWLLINTALVLILLVFDPEMMRTLLNTTVLMGNKVLTMTSPPPLPEDPVTLALWAIGGGWGFTALVFVGLLGGLLLAGYLLRRLLTWYAFPAADRRLIRIGWSIILIIALLWGLVILPPPTAAIQGDLASLVRPALLITSALALLIAGGWSLWFLRADRLYGRRCPSCGGQVPGWFELGKKCPTCGTTLHPWLLAGY